MGGMFIFVVVGMGKWGGWMMGVFGWMKIEWGFYVCDEYGWRSEVSVGVFILVFCCIVLKFLVLWCLIEVFFGVILLMGMKLDL